jgi:hypothetical protein
VGSAGGSGSARLESRGIESSSSMLARICAARWVRKLASSSILGCLGSSSSGRAHRFTRPAGPEILLLFLGLQNVQDLEGSTSGVVRLRARVGNDMMFCATQWATVDGCHLGVRKQA